MYFSFIPDVKYDTKPIKYPFSQSDYLRVKNFFRRYVISEDVFSYIAYFKKYAIQDGDRLDSIAEKAYGDPFYDWIIILTNGMINPIFDWPLTTFELNKYLENEFDNAYGTIMYYQTIEDELQEEMFGQVLLKGGTKVDEFYYNSVQKFNIDGIITDVSASSFCTEVSIADHETKENEKKREIYLLKPQYLNDFVSEFRKTNLYKKSTSFVSTDLKQSNR
jgi:hypothetical protein